MNRPTKKLLIIIVIGLLMAAAGAAGVFWASAAASGIRLSTLNGKTKLQEAEQAFLRRDLSASLEALAASRANFAETSAALKRWSWLAPLPWVGAQFKAAGAVIDSGRELAAAFSPALLWLKDVEVLFEERGALNLSAPEPTVTFEKLSVSDKRLFISKIAEAAVLLADLRRKIDASLQALDASSQTALVAGLERLVTEEKERLGSLRAEVNRLLRFAEIVSPLAGYPDQKTYLVLLQNNTELRPSGGFWGTVGLLAVKDGGIKSLLMDDVYSFDRQAEPFLREPPPAPLKKYLGIENLFLRDANWSPDFPEAARQAIKFFEAESRLDKSGFAAERLDGVIAFTPTLIERLLRITGPIAAGGERFTPENLTDKLEYRVEIGYAGSGIPPRQRKDIVGQLAAELLDRLFKLRSGQWPEVLSVFDEAVKERQVIFFGSDAKAQNAFMEAGAAGEVREASDDYLLAVDANLGSLKSDPVVARSIFYALKKTGDELKATVRITYRHEGTFTWKTSRYRTYTRLYIPAGSRLISQSGGEKDSVAVSEDAGKTVFGAFIVIEPGTSRTLEFSYFLPQRIADGINRGYYELLAEKQAGTLGHPLTLELNFGKKVKRASPPEEPGEWGDGVYRLKTDLRVDREINIGF